MMVRVWPSLTVRILKAAMRRHIEGTDNTLATMINKGLPESKQHQPPEVRAAIDWLVEHGYLAIDFVEGRGWRCKVTPLADQADEQGLLDEDKL